jgi:oxygen-dependent protoporphyrinogen oxidase
MQSDQSFEVVVVGGGIGGLTTAFYLAQAQIKVAVMEMDDRWGGSIISRQQGEWLWEEGPNSFSPNQALLELVEALGLEERLVWADAKLPRFVWWDDRLQAVPSSPPALLSTQLLSPLGKLRAVVGALGFVRPSAAGAESVADFFERHLGREVLERLVAPFVSGVYAGDPRQLGVKSAFSKVWQMEQMGGGLMAGFIASRGRSQPTIKPRIKLGQLGSFRQGLQELPDTIVRQLSLQDVPLRLGWRLTNLAYDPASACYRLTFATPDGQQLVTAKKVVLAIPAYSCSAVLADLCPRASKQLATIVYPPVACVALGYPLTDLRKPLVGFGNLIPRGQGIRTLGTIWSSSLFPQRAPSGYQLLLNFIGGTTDVGIGELAPETIVEAVDRDLRHTLLKSTASAPKVLAVKLWRRAIPQYDLHHSEKMTTLHQELANYPHLYVGANFTDGVAVGDCVRRGKEIAKQCQTEGR